MNIGAIKRHILANKECTIVNAPNGSQWIHAAGAMFAVEGVRITEESIVPLFGLDKRQADTVRVLMRDTIDTRLRQTPLYDEEETQEAGALINGGDIYIALPSMEGLLFIKYEDVQHIKPENRRYAIRWDRDFPCVAVYGDMLCSVLVEPESHLTAQILHKEAVDMAAPIYRSEADKAADAEAIFNETEDTP